MLQRLQQVLTTLCLKWECELVEFGGEADHIHMLIEAHPSIEPAKLLGNLKSVSSRKIRQEYAQHLAKYFWKPYFWSRSYSVFSVGGRAPLEVLVKYIQEQDEPEE